MCPPALDRPADMVFNGFDEEAILYLDSFRPGSPIPKNVIEDNPYQYRPSNLPDRVWFVVHSTEKKKNDFGFWRVKEQASEIFTNSSIIGWRTTLEFVELLNSLERRRTDWVMEEYRITQKVECATNKEKELRTMCRVLLMSSNKEMYPNSKGAVTDGGDHVHTVPSIDLNIDNLSTKVFRSQFSDFHSLATSLKSNNAVDGTTILSAADKLLDPWRDISDHHVFNGDYLELDDLADPQSRSSSSDNSSRSSMTFDEYFDPIALLQELEDNNNQKQEGKDSSSRFSVAGSTKPFEVVMQPATSGSLVYAAGRQQPSGCKVASAVIETKFLDERIANHTVKKLKAEQRDQGPSCSPSVVASFSTTIPIPKGKKEATVVKTKRLKKYCCFIPF